MNDPLFNLSLRSVLLLQNELTKSMPFTTHIGRYLTSLEADDMFTSRNINAREWWEYNATLILLILEAQDPQES